METLAVFVRALFSQDALLFASALITTIIAEALSQKIRSGELIQDDIPTLFFLRLPSG